MSTEGDMFELLVGQVAAGGGCAARLPDGRVAFVRHTLPGERVVARVTKESSRYVLADAVEVVESAPGRVSPPCRHAGAGRCGGCDWQHVSLEVQRGWKSFLVGEQLRRIAGIDLPLEVEALPGDARGLGWRTRVRYSVSADGTLGLRRHRSHEIERIDRCLIAAPGVEAARVEELTWPGAAEVEVFAPGPDGECVISAVSLGAAEAGRGGRHRPRVAGGAGAPRRRLGGMSAPPGSGGLVLDGHVVREPGRIVVTVLGHVSWGSFWQVHRGAAEALGRAVIEMGAASEGERVADLYAGVGLFSILLARAVGSDGSVLAVESDAGACADAEHNLAGAANIAVLHARVTPDLVAHGLGNPDIVVLDPPRRGAGVDTMASLAGLSPRLRRVVYVACDPASFARDLRVLLDAGWSLASLRALDLFPMTEHVELVAAIDAPAGAPRPSENVT
jgi:tRNA/tmRNA/rRNA uracil-C5-methylase (TrmA/RlmC/RlmD family)